MDIVVKVISAVMSVMTAWLMLLMVWQLLVSLFGFKRNTKNYQDHAPQMRFLVLVPAHNEEAVIGGIINNLNHMDYPREMYDFYILADNCTDDTAGVARRMGANVLEFFKPSPDSPTGKPIALQKALNALGDYHEKYDLVMFFDADNLVDRNMFTEVNSQFVDAGGKVDVIQCYLGSKNRKGVVALFYYTSYTITNRFFQFAKTNMGLNSVIGGTGFAVSAEYLHKRGGWTAMSLTEDFELQIEATCEGRRIVWNNNVRIYDEKPTRFRASFRQRIRWAQGHWFVAFKNTPKLIRAFLKGKIKPLEFFSTFLYMYSLTPFVFLVIQQALGAVVEIFKLAGLVEKAAASITLASWLTLNLPGIAIFFYMFVFLFYVAEAMDNHIKPSLKVLLPMLWSISINTVVAGWAQVVGLWKHRHQNQWVKTEHRINTSEEMTVSLSDVGAENDESLKA